MQQGLEADVQGAIDPTNDPARRPLILLAVFASIATTTGTFIYAYPETLASVFDEMIIAHDVTGDLTIAVGGWYLYIHLKRTWRMWRRVLQRWSGYAAVAVWIVAAVTGVYGPILPMPSGSTMSSIHAISATAFAIVGCVHAGYGLRRYFA